MRMKEQTTVSAALNLIMFDNSCIFGGLGLLSEFNHSHFGDFHDFELNSDLKHRIQIAVLNWSSKLHSLQIDFRIGSFKHHKYLQLVTVQISFRFKMWRVSKCKTKSGLNWFKFII